MKSSFQFGNTRLVLIEHDNKSHTYLFQELYILLGNQTENCNFDACYCECYFIGKP